METVDVLGDDILYITCDIIMRICQQYFRPTGTALTNFKIFTCVLVLVNNNDNNLMTCASKLKIARGVPGELADL